LYCVLLNAENAITVALSHTHTHVCIHTAVCLLISECAHTSVKVMIQPNGRSVAVYAWPCFCAHLFALHLPASRNHSYRVLREPGSWAAGELGRRKGSASIFSEFPSQDLASKFFHWCNLGWEVGRICEHAHMRKGNISVPRVLTKQLLLAGWTSPRCKESQDVDSGSWAAVDSVCGLASEACK